MNSIPFDIDAIISIIDVRQGLEWNGGVFNSDEDFSILYTLLDYMNSGVPVEDYFYKGDIYRIHCRSDEPPFELPVTKYTNKISCFSKSYDFTKECYYKVCKKDQSIFFHANTGSMYGLDVTAFLNKFGKINRFEGEEEVLFPFSKEYIIKEYRCTPNQFKYYMRGG